jgi:phosphoribosylanthranilate isomerase
MHVRIKICGITNPADAEQAAALGADMIGLNFYVKSPRCIDDTTAYSILNVLPDSIEPVALFVNKPLLAVQRKANGFRISTVQVYGNPSGPLPHRTNWITAFRVSDVASLHRISSYLELLTSGARSVNEKSINAAPYAILVDAHVPGTYGGTGQKAPWHLLAEFKPGVPLILAGGLTPENVADAIRIVQPYAVDVASGVESAPGMKDADKLRRFVDAVRSAT